MDYEEFVECLISQVEENAPDDLNLFHKRFLCNYIKEYSLLAAESLFEKEDEIYKEKWEVITQLVAEWTFHKCIDLMRSRIPQKYWEAVLQKLAFTVYESAKLAIEKGLSQDEMLAVIENNINKYYIESVLELYESGLIDNNVKECAIGQSNVDEMYAQYKEKEKLPSNKVSMVYKVIAFLYFLFTCLYIIAITPDSSYSFLFKCITLNLIAVYGLYSCNILKTRMQAGLNAILFVGCMFINYFTDDRFLVKLSTLLLFIFILFGYSIYQKYSEDEK